MKKMKSVPYGKIQAHSKRLILRPYKLTDFARCQASHRARRSKLNQFDEAIPASAVDNYEAFRKRIERFRDSGKRKVHFVFGVFDRKSGDYVGQVDIFVINQQMCWGNLGYTIQNQHWGNGYASEAGRLALGIAFKKLFFHRMEAGAELKNKASIRVAQKIGMTKEGVRKKFFAHQGGIDLVVFGTNAMDWRAR